MKRIFGITAVLTMAAAFVLSLTSPATAGTRVMAGKHVVVMDIVAADWENHPVENIPNYKNGNFSQRVLSRDEFGIRIKVEVNLEPLKSSAPFPIQGISDPVARKCLRPEKMIQSDHPDIINKAREITAGARTVAEAVEKISNWVHDHVTYTIPVQQDALSVFYSGKGSCQGYTRLTIALCRAVGIPARYAHGYLPPGEDWGARVERFGVKTSGGGYHAWIEIYYPDAGWYFTDGEYTKNYVDPFHIVRWIDDEPSTPIPANPVENLDADTGNTYSKVEETNDLRWVDYYSGPKKEILGIAIRPQQTGAVWGVLTDANGNRIRKGKLIIWGEPDASGYVRGEVISLPESGIYSVAGLGTGKKKITIQVGDVKRDFVVEAQAGTVQRKDIVFR